MTEIVIRAQEPDDAAAVTEVLNQPRVVWGTLQLPFASVEQRRRRMTESLTAGDLRLVAAIDGRVIGLAGLHRETHVRRAHVASFGMGVHDAWTGRGAGAALMAALIDQADRWLNLRRLELTVWADNARAIALYERFGFQREGLLRDHGWRDGAYVDCLAMARLRPEG
jgi:putative acetyltransferase